MSIGGEKIKKKEEDAFVEYILYRDDKLFNIS